MPKSSRCANISWNLHRTERSTRSYSCPKRCAKEAKKQGADIRENGYAVLESTVWKEEDGKFYYDTGIQGEVLGEKVDSFAEISLLPDDCLLYNLGTMILERA